MLPPLIILSGNKFINQKEKQLYMKTNYIIIFSAFLSAILFVGCDKHDTLDDNVIVGQMAPHVYWEIGSSTVNAGSNVPFKVQYYTTGETPINHLEVWYSIKEDEIKTVTSPWMTTFKYTVTSSVSAERRASQQISTYPHDQSYWNKLLRAYSFEASFPTSTTLSSISWVKPSSFNATDSAKMIRYFGNTYMQHFKDSLFTLMKVKDFQNMYQGLNLVDNFKIYIDSIENKNTGGYDYVFPKDAQGNRPIPKALVDIYKKIPFADLIFDKTSNNYGVEFTRSYTLRPKMKVVDEKSIEGVTSINPDVSLN